ncbi:MAG: DUF1800 domain-containing protein [Candidatus Hydrogenedentes bacterium]|nr:DUF1800 domain-containing protein [Candidatus Hydrogenedentota bacterium]
MRISRRNFIQAASALSAAALTGCDQTVRFLGVPQAPGLAGPFEVAATSTVDPVTHVLRRLTFGPRPGDYARVAAMGIDAFMEEQLNPDAIDDYACDSLVRRNETLAAPLGELFEYKQDLLLRELTRATVQRAVYSNRQLYEVMVEFWSDHFNIAQSKGDCAWLKTADDRDVIRKHALGNFSELLRASALSPAMLWYLDGRANKKSNDSEKANENYARELLELHTLGVHGGYTQRDVMETARCLTGWTVRSEQKFFKGRLEFREDWHDDGEKTVLGQMIPAGGRETDIDRVIEIVTAHPSTAQYLAWKLCRRFIADDPQQSAVDAVAAAFTASKGDIKTTLRALFATEEFRASTDAKFKRPLRYVASALRATAAECDPNDALYQYLLRMGHTPFQYPTPDGYPEEAEHWMGSMLWRWHFTAALAESRIEGTQVDWKKLDEYAGGERMVVAHLLGRDASELETQCCTESGAGPVFMLASPSFQRF